MARIVIAPSARHDLERLPRVYASAVDAAILELGEEPLPGKRLKGGLAGLRSKRVGAYRIVYRFTAKASLVEIVWIRHRSEAYR